MADYQEYRRRILHRRWRRVFIIVALLALVALLSAIGILWKVLHRERVDTALSQNTILRQVTTDNTWNTVNYPLARQLRVQTLEDSTETALDFRMAALPASAPVEKSWFAQVSFVGDSLTQGLQIYDTGLPGAQFCAYKGVGPNAFVNGTSCKRADGVTEIPLDALTAQQPKAVYVLLGSNVLGRDTDYTSFLTYYRLMLDMISQALPDAKNLCAVHHAGKAGGERTGKPRRAEPRPPVPHQQRAGRHCAGKGLLFPQSVGGAGRRKW